jgi:carbon storage regulator
MLVLTRKQGDKIRIGDDVVITVVRTKGKTVRLGIQAPLHVPVLRGEIAAAMAGEQLRPARDASATTDKESPPVDASDGGESGSKTVQLCSDSRACSASVAAAAASRGPLRELLDARR